VSKSKKKKKRAPAEILAMRSILNEVTIRCSSSAGPHITLRYSAKKKRAQDKLDERSAQLTREGE
jgi:hypothetical protein